MARAYTLEQARTRRLLKRAREAADDPTAEEWGQESFTRPDD